MKVYLLNIIKWAALAIALSMLAWWLLGKSPTLKQVISFVLSGFFLFLAIENRMTSAQMRREHAAQLGVLREIRDSLRE